MLWERNQRRSLTLIVFVGTIDILRKLSRDKRCVTIWISMLCHLISLNIMIYQLNTMLFVYKWHKIKLNIYVFWMGTTIIEYINQRYLFLLSRVVISVMIPFNFRDEISIYLTPVNILFSLMFQLRIDWRWAQWGSNTFIVCIYIYITH